MRRKVYATDRERKSDQLFGALVFPLVNLVVGLITILLLAWPVESTIGIRLLPWVVNGLILTLAFLFRPQMAIGYIASVALIVGTALMLGVWIISACVVSLPGWFLGPVGPALFLVVFLFGLNRIVRWASSAFKNWWSPPPTEAKDRRAQDVDF